MIAALQRRAHVQVDGPHETPRPTGGRAPSCCISVLGLLQFSCNEMPGVRKLDDEWPESIFHHVGSQSASYPVSVQ